MSVQIEVVGKPQPPKFVKPANTSRNTVLTVAAGEKAQTIASVSVVNEDNSTARIVGVEHYDGTTYRMLWRKSVAANDTADVSGFPVGTVVMPGSSIVVTAAAADVVTVTLNTVQQT